MSKWRNTDSAESHPAADEARRVPLDVRGGQGVQAGDHGLQVNTFVNEQHVHAARDVSWPVQVGRPPLLAEAFQSRHELWKTTQAGHEPGAAMLSQVFSGGGGTGKSQLAVAVFLAARDSGCDLLVWVNAATRDEVTTTYAHAAERVDAFSDSSADAKRRAEMFLAWLATTSRSWLIVLDDLGDPADVSGLWPAGRSGRVLVTTRRRDAAVTGPGREMINVGVFDPEESVAYLRAKLRDAVRDGRVPPNALDGARELAAELGHLPLALAQAAAVVLDEGISCAVYLAQFADRSLRLAELFPATSPADEYARTAATTWSLAIDRADALPPGHLARPALELGAVTDPSGMPETFWSTEAARTYLGAGGMRANTQEPARPASAQDARRALRNLHRLSLITHEPGHGPRAVRVHALVQRAATDRLTDAEYVALVRAAADALVQAWPEAESDPGLGQALRQNASALADRHAAALWDRHAHPVCYRAGRSLGEAGLTREAAAHFQRLLDDCRRLLGPDDPDVRTSRASLAYWLAKGGNLAGAALAFDDLLADCLRVLGPDHPDTLTARANRAYWRGRAGSNADSGQELERVLADCLRVLGPDHLDTLAAWHNLARWRGLAGDAARAAHAFGELLAARIRVLGPDHPHTLATRHTLAHWRGRAGDAAGAAQAQEDLLADCLRLLGPDHRDTLAARHSLARWRGDAGDAAGAAAALAEVLSDDVRILGSDHPDALITKANLAYWRGRAGDPAGAAVLLAETLSDSVRVLGADHPDTLATRGNLARWRGQSGDAAGAAQAFAALLGDYLRVLGPGHSDTLTTRALLACWRGQAGDVTGAVTALGELHGDLVRALGPDHPDTLTTRHNLARWRARAGDVPGAVQAFGEVLADDLRVLGPNHPDALTTRANLAYWRGRAGDVRGARNAMEEVVDDCVRALGPGHHLTRAVQASLAFWRERAESSDNAEVNPDGVD